MITAPEGKVLPVALLSKLELLRDAYLRESVSEDETLTMIEANVPNGYWSIAIDYVLTEGTMQ